MPFLEMEFSTWTAPQKCQNAVSTHENFAPASSRSPVSTHMRKRHPTPSKQRHSLSGHEYEGQFKSDDSTLTKQQQVCQNISASYLCSAIKSQEANVSHASNISRTQIGENLPTRELQSSQKTTGLNFYLRNFTRPIEHDAEKLNLPSNRRFSFRSRGSIVAACIMLAALLGAIAGATALTWTHRGSIERVILEGTTPIRAAIPNNFPDPAIWFADGLWYAFATNNAAGVLEQPGNVDSPGDNGAANVQLAISENFVDWEIRDLVSDPLPTLGLWAVQGITDIWPHIPRANVWAPSVNQRPMDGRFVLYYSANCNGSIIVEDDNDSETHEEDWRLYRFSFNGRGRGGKRRKQHPSPRGPSHCVGAAISESTLVAGPYNPMNSTIACPVEQGGAIDPSGFTDEDGTMYIVYKVDGNNIGHGGLCGNTDEPLVPTPIMLQKLQQDGVTTDGEPIQIIDREPSDGPLVEAPDLVRSHEGVYFLFFSSGCTTSPSYNVKYATATSISGPYTRAGAPLLQTGDFGLLAPGSVGVHVDADGGWNMAFHTRVNMPQGGVRAMFTTKLLLEGTVAKLVYNATAKD